MSNFVSLEQITYDHLCEIVDNNEDVIGTHIMYTVHDNPKSSYWKHAIYVGKEQENGKPMFIQHSNGSWKEPNITHIKKRNMSELFYPKLIAVYVVKYKMVNTDASVIAYNRAYEAFNTYEKLCKEYSKMFQNLFEEHQKGNEDTTRLEEQTKECSNAMHNYSNRFVNSSIFAFWCWTGTISNVSNGMFLQLLS
jgi:hypothetical protein